MFFSEAMGRDAKNSRPAAEEYIKKEKSGMITRRFKEEQYKAVEKYILTAARSSPLMGVYEVELTLNGECFSVYLQPDSRCRVNALYARRVHGGVPSPVAGGAVLLAMLELIAWQAIRRETELSPYRM